ncbi:MAG: hypothetical protein U9R74_14125 [Pseudomonadota bacterium]|nr:hypothetical protein [Pseudomonadota bacterium]
MGYTLRMVVFGPGGKGMSAQRVEVRVTRLWNRLALLDVGSSRRLAGRRGRFRGLVARAGPG